MTQMVFPPSQLTFDSSVNNTLYGIVATDTNVCKGDGERVVTTPEKPKRKTYPQDWRAYNGAQTHEKELFLYLLRELCDTVPQPLYTRGRPRLPLSDMLFSIGVKVFAKMSTRRVMSDVRDSKAKALLDAIPSTASIFRYMADPALTPHLESLVVRSALPMRVIEVDFAADSSGFSTSVYRRWFDAKYGKEMSMQEWVKAHAMSGITTNVVTAVVVTPGHDADAPQLPDLLKTTASGFDVREVSADKAYLSKRNLRAIHDAGAAPYIPFKVNSVGGQPGDRDYDSLWDKLYHYYCLNAEIYMEHYHKRSNVESTFSMVKGKFNGSVLTKLHEAQVNEVLAKFLCHNICVVIQSVYELGKTGIIPGFHPQTFEANGHSGAAPLLDAHSLNEASGAFGANGTNGATSIFDAEWPFASKIPVKRAY